MLGSGTIVIAVSSIAAAVEVEQAAAADLKMTPEQATAASLKMTPEQATAASLKMTPEQATAASLKMEPTQTTHDNHQVNANAQVGDTDIGLGNPMPTQGIAQGAVAGDVHEPAVNTAAVVTKAAGGAGVSHCVGTVAWSYDGDPTAGSLTITDGGTTVFKIDITKGGPGFVPFVPPRKGGADAAVVATLAAGGAGVSGIINLHTWTEA